MKTLMKISNFKSREKQRVEAFNVSPADIESEIEEMNEFIRDLEAANANKVSIRNVIEYTYSRSTAARHPPIFRKLWATH